MTTPAEDFAAIVGAMLDGVPSEAPADTEPEQEAPRLPKPNLAQGAGGEPLPLDPGALFARELLDRLGPRLMR